MTYLSAPFTTASAPWWFVAALAGGLTIVSTTLGALVSVYSTKESDRRKAEQENRSGEREQHRQRYSDLSAAGTHFLVEARQHVRNIRSQTQAPDPSAKDLDLYDARRVYEAYWPVIWLADDSVGQAARLLLETTRDFGRAPVDNTLASSLASQYAEHLQARSDFVHALKVYLESLK